MPRKSDKEVLGELAYKYMPLYLDAATEITRLKLELARQLLLHPVPPDRWRAN